MAWTIQPGGQLPLRQRSPGWGGRSTGSATGRRRLEIFPDGLTRVNGPAPLTAGPANTPTPPRSVEALDETPLVAFGILDRQHPNAELAVNWRRGLMSTGPDV